MGKACPPLCLMLCHANANAMRRQDEPCGHQERKKKPRSNNCVYLFHVWHISSSAHFPPVSSAWGLACLPSPDLLLSVMVPSEHIRAHTHTRTHIITTHKPHPLCSISQPARQRYRSRAGPCYCHLPGNVSICTATEGEVGRAQSGRESPEFDDMDGLFWGCQASHLLLHHHSPNVIHHAVAALTPDPWPALCFMAHLLFVVTPPPLPKYHHYLIINWQLPRIARIGNGMKALSTMMGRMQCAPTWGYAVPCRLRQNAQKEKDALEIIQLQMFLTFSKWYFWFRPVSFLTEVEGCIADFDVFD